MAFFHIGSEPTRFFCKLKKIRISQELLKKKGCIEKNCTELTLWRYMKHRYRK